MEANFKEVNGHLIEIKEQVKKTNGRVNSLEKSRIQIWTAISIVVGISGGIITLGLYALDSRIDKSVQSALSVYDIESYENQINK